MSAKKAVKKPAKKRGAPKGSGSTYSLEAGRRIADLMADDGLTFPEACEKEGRKVSTVFGWITDHPEFGALYARAREVRGEVEAEKMQSIADDGSNDWMAANKPDDPGYVINGEHVQRSRLRIDTMKWRLSKMLPKKYGEKVTQEITGADGGPIQQEHSLVALDFDKVRAKRAK